MKWMHWGLEQLREAPADYVERIMELMVEQAEEAEFRMHNVRR